MFIITREVQPPGLPKLEYETVWVAECELTDATEKLEELGKADKKSRFILSIQIDTWG